MADTFQKIWRQVRLHCPMAPALLAQEWVTEAYREVCDRGDFSWLRAETEILTSAQRSGTVNVTRGSLTVTGVGLTFVAGDATRQFRISTSQPPYTIDTVNVGANTCALDRVFGGTTAAATTATILDAYITMPADFLRPIAMLDPSNGWQLHIWYTEDEINARDPQRSSTGTPWALVSRRLATISALAGRVQYELWPYATTQRNYPLYYIRRAEDLTDTTSFLGPLANRADLLTTGALVKAALWPGLEGRKNPYYNPQIALMLEKKFQAGVDRLQVIDQEIYPTWWETVSMLRAPFAPIDSKFLQSHDFSATVGY